MKRKLTKRNKSTLSRWLAFGNRNHMYLKDVISLKRTITESLMTRRHERRFGAVPDANHPEVQNLYGELFFVPCVSSRGKVCHFISMTSAELEAAKAAA